MADKKISQLTAASTPLAGTEVLPIVQSSATVKVSVENLTAGRAVTASSVTTTGNTQGAALLSIAASGTNGVSIGDYGSDAGTFRIAAISGRNLTFINDYAGLEDARFDASGNYKITRGNLIQGTAAKGVNFTANTGAAGMTSQLLNWYEEGTCSFTVTSTSGTLTTASASAVYTRVGRIVTITGTVTVTTNGTGAGALTVAGLPFTPSTAACGVGRESVNNGKTCSFMVSASSTSMDVQAYDNTYPVSSGSVIQFSVSYSV